ncbi:Rne/Rng family ribonuclease [Xanthobacter sp. TB0136]|uniref:Rne/Rng family ribonuclease n=1 Tax=Xanthobacter sp. TB0136 TaxID=3459177 RepID=UPI004039358B
MANKMLIDATHPEETRVVVVRGNRVEEFDYESASRKQLRGNIYLAKVTRVEPSLQAAFVEYGGNRHGFLAFSEIHPDYYQIPVADRLALLEEEERAARLAEDEVEVREKRRDRGRSRNRSHAPAEPEAVEDAVVSDAAENEAEDHAVAESVAVEAVSVEAAVAPAEAADEPAPAPEAGDAAAPVVAEPEDAAPAAAAEPVEIAPAAPEAALPVEEPVAVPVEDEISPVAETVASEAPAVEEKREETSGDAEAPASSGEETAGRKAEPFAARVDSVVSEPAPAQDDEDEARKAEGDDVEDRLIAEASEAAEQLALTEPESDEQIEAEAQAALDELPPLEPRARTRNAPRAAAKADSSDHSDNSDSSDDDDEDDSDIEQIDEDDEIEHLGSDDDAMEEVPERSHHQRRAKTYKIQEVIRRRQVMLVQVVKEERGNKGAALTTYLSLAGRYSVLMPNTARGGGISRKITNAVDRKRLKEVVQELEVPEGMGIILRTAGANRTKTEIKRDFEYLLRLWETVRELTLSSAAPSLVYEEGSLIKRAIRDLYNKDIDEVIVAGEEGYKEAKDFMRMLMPSHAKIVQPYRDPQPIYARYGVEQQLDAMFSPVVQLKSGGYIVINPTEALVSIDVNSGRSTREHHIEDTALKTNMEAAEEIARQLRLRDLAGLIVVDFIDMEEKRNNRAVERKLKDCLKNDRARIQIGRISHFGLLEMSRQRIRTGVLESSIEVCPHCGGTGHVRSAASVALQLIRALEEQLLRSASHNLNARARLEVALYVLNQKRPHLRELEDRFGVNINIIADADVTGHHPFVIEKGEPAAPPAAPRSAPVVQPDSILLDEEFIEEEDVEADDNGASEKETDASDENGDEANRRRRRRRRRRGDRRDDGSDEASGNDDVSASEGDDESSSTDEDDSGEEARADGEDGDDDNGDRRRRRRGRRGGRRNRRERDGDEAAADSSGDDADGESAPEAEAGVSDADEPVADEDHAPAPEADEGDSKGDAVVAAPAIAELAPAEEPSAPREEVKAKPAVAPVAPVAVEAEEEPAKPARRRRNTVREKAPALPAETAAQDDVTSAPVAEIAVPAETGTVETVEVTAVQETPEAQAPEPEASPVTATAEEAPAEAIPAPAEDEAPKPRRSGWWQRKPASE